MTKDPKITMDTVKLAASLNKPFSTADICFPDVVLVAAQVEQIGRQIHALNERTANLGSGGPHDIKADRLSDKLAAMLAPYGAKFSRYGRGSGLWPFVETSDGKDFSL